MAADIYGIDRSFSALAKVSQAAAPYEGLGYRGFILRPHGDALGQYSEIRICRGMVEAQRGGTREHFQEPSPTLEK
jgi:hypothetical protein